MLVLESVCAGVGISLSRNEGDKADNQSIGAKYDITYHGSSTWDQHPYNTYYNIRRSSHSIVVIA